MLFSKKDEGTSERVLYETKPNMILGCKKAIYGIVLLAIVFVVSPMVIQFIGEMQVYLISYIQVPLTRYAAIAFFVVILVIILYIIWQFLQWFSIEYTLTDSRIIIKKGLLSTKKNYMPYRAIQDINTTQNIFAKLFNVATVSAYSAYDNNQISLENISNPSEAEDIIFSNMLGHKNFQEPPRNFINNSYDDSRYVEDSGYDEYYDEYEPITPIGHERNSYQRREYEYYPEEEFSFQESGAKKYEYEPYGDELVYSGNRVMNVSNDNIRYEGSQNAYSNDGHYNEVSDNYSNAGGEYYQDNQRDIYANNGDGRLYQNEQKQVDEVENSQEKIIRRHFDKFKR